MKVILQVFLLIALSIPLLSIRPPSPLCRTNPIPSQIPISIGEEVRFDLGHVFSGYNLLFNGSQQSHISINQKFTPPIESMFPTSYNFSNVKIKPSGRFLGLVTKGSYSGLVVGTSNDQTGITISFEVDVENITNLNCFDIDEIFFGRESIVIVDCAGVFPAGVAYNEFLYVNLTERKVIEGSHFSDLFVHYRTLTKRRIQIMVDPFTRLSYLLRFNLRDGVNVEHQDQTFAEIFLMNNPLHPQLLDVIDHTFLHLDKLSIVDYQVFADLIYIWVYNKGLYEIRFTPDQYLQIRSRFDMQLDITRFRVDRLGFNDDLNLVATNGNFIYQFQWDVTSPPMLTNKYTLVPNSVIEQIFVDYNYVIVTATSVFQNNAERRTWIFTKRSNTYLNAYNVFHVPSNATHLIVWNQHGSTLHIIHSYSAIFFKMSLPYLTVKPVNDSMGGKTQTYEVIAKSYGDSGDATCSQKFEFVYIARGDHRIVKTGLWPRNQINVDSPDERQIPLTFEFFGPNLTYNVNFATNTTITPYFNVNKQHRAVFVWPKEIVPAKISFFQMFNQGGVDGVKPTAVYGLVQVQDVTESKIIYLTYYVQCKINVFDRDQTHHLNCRIVHTTNFPYGKIIATSHMYDPRMRRIAITFDSLPHTIFVFDFTPTRFNFFGRKDYAGDVANWVTGVEIAHNKLFVVLEYGKRVDIFDLDDIREQTDVPRQSVPKMVINSQVMRFFGVGYFAPVDILVSQFHPEVIFLKTKTGVMVLNINEQNFPELLFTVPTLNIRYDYEVNDKSLLVITETQSTLYELQVPLRRLDPPRRRSSIASTFILGEYDEISSDRLFFVVGAHGVNVVNPTLYSTSALYSQIEVKDPVISIDAVNIIDMEILFIHTKNEIIGYVLAENPVLTVMWHEKTGDFKLSLSAQNSGGKSEPYTLQFNVLDVNETEIAPTEDFNETAVKKLGYLKVPTNNISYSANININDSEWFKGTVLKYELACQSEQCKKSVSIRNHVEQTRDVIKGRAIYDIESTLYGIYAQQYNSLLKSYTHNDSIHYISHVPTERQGEVCTKLATGQNQDFIVSLCQVGSHVNVYITSTVGSKPFTFGPYQTDAKAVNHAKIVGEILMIVDNDDNPLARAGGIYLYHLNFDFEDPDFISMLDYIDYEDLQIQGFTGTPFIGSADMHTPFYDVDHEYRLFLTEVRTGAIFVFGFQVSADGEELVYLSKKYIPLQKLIPPEIRYPTPLRVQTINIHFSFDNKKTVEYYLLLSCLNWHHMEIQLTLTHTDEIVGFKLERLFERYPWGKPQNYFKFRRGRLYETYFAIPYINFEQEQQLILIYSVPFILNANALTYQEKYSKHSYQLLNMQVPILRAFGAHPVQDVFETAFAFHTFGSDKLLWSDMHGTDIKQISLFKNLSINVNQFTKTKETLHITALNVYSNYTFDIELNFEKDQDDGEKKSFLWIIIIVVASTMILGLLIAWVKQRKTHVEQVSEENKQTLLTVEDEYKNNYIDINRTSVDPGSVRDSIQPALHEPVPHPIPKANLIREQEEGSSSSQEGQNLTH